MSGDARDQVIMVVDDDATNVRLAIDALEGHGYEVVVARTGESAVARARFAHPDLILLDVQMPGADGFEVCRWLKAESSTAGTPVIFMTVRSEIEDKIAGFRAGAVDYVTKPLQLEELLARVQTHLTIRRLQAELQAQNEHLEQRVQERTAALADSNQALQNEIEQRQLHQAEKDKLFELAQGQAEQLRDLTNLMVDAQHSRQRSLADRLRDDVERKVGTIESHLYAMRAALGELDDPVASKLTVHLQNVECLLDDIKHGMSVVSSDLRRPIPEADNPLVRLSAREREILQLIAAGKPITEMADLLMLSASTIYTHRAHLLDKLKLSTTADLVRFALEHRSFS